MNGLVGLSRTKMGEARLPVFGECASMCLCSCLVSLICQCVYTAVLNNA